MPVAGIGDRDIDGADGGLDIVDDGEHGVVVGHVELAGYRPPPRRRSAEGIRVCRLPNRADNGVAVVERSLGEGTSQSRADAGDEEGPSVVLWRHSANLHDVD